MKKLLCILVGLLFLFSTSAFTTDTIAKYSPDTKVSVTFNPAKISVVTDMDVANNNIIRAKELQLLDTFVTSFKGLSRTLGSPMVNSPPDYVIKYNTIYKYCSIASIPILLLFIIWLVYMSIKLDFKAFLTGLAIFVSIMIVILFLVPYIANRAINNDFFIARDVLLFSG